jgi:hypothetical protein
MCVLAACESEPPQLNSERILQKFGSYGVQILQADDARRISSLYSDDKASGRTCRTFAIVEFALPVDRQIRAEHERIVAGQSIGQVFVDAGWKIDKQNLFIGESNASGYGYKLDELMRVDEQQSLATHRYKFVVEYADRRIEYATITEVHHPDYFNSSQLRLIYEKYPGI